MTTGYEYMYAVDHRSGLTTVFLPWTHAPQSYHIQVIKGMAMSMHGRSKARVHVATISHAD